LIIHPSTMEAKKGVSSHTRSSKPLWRVQHQPRVPCLPLQHGEEEQFRRFENSNLVSLEISRIWTHSPAHSLNKWSNLFSNSKLYYSIVIQTFWNPLRLALSMYRFNLICSKTRIFLSRSFTRGAQRTWTGP
jgi:hypothetical protein